MVFNSTLITPKKEDIFCIQKTPFLGGENIMVYSYTSDKKEHYLSHVYHIDQNQTGLEFIYGPKGEFVAEFPLWEGKANGKGKVCYMPHVQVEQYFYYGEVFPTVCNNYIVAMDGDPVIVALSADVSSFKKSVLIQKKLPDYICASVPQNYRIMKRADDRQHE
ncbi:MAG: hypothetical protein SPL08_00295 [Pseudomonadota bacterium]|nr:hypothetical protein [Pseudomonadota bacterium]